MFYLLSRTRFIWTLWNLNISKKDSISIGQIQLTNFLFLATFYFFSKKLYLPVKKIFLSVYYITLIDYTCKVWRSICKTKILNQFKMFVCVSKTLLLIQKTTWTIFSLMVRIMIIFTNSILFIRLHLIFMEATERANGGLIWKHRTSQNIST